MYTSVTISLGESMEFGEDNFKNVGYEVLRGIICQIQNRFTTCKYSIYTQKQQHKTTHN